MKNQGYRHSPYLCFVAARCWDKKSNRCVFQLGAGQGKTFVALLLAERHRSEKKTVTIVVPDKISVSQFEGYTLAYCSEHISTIRAKDLKSTHKSDVFICDESDLLLNKHVVSFAQLPHSSLKELRGLGVIFHAKKTYFMSATYDAYEKKLLQQTFIYPESEIIVFENLLSLVSGVKQGDFDLKSEVEKEVPQLKSSLLSLVKKELELRPFIIFMAKQEQDLVDELQKLCEERGVPFVEVYDSEDADEKRRLYDNQTKGVFVLSRAFGRSYDLKLAAEAQVLILMNERTISYTEAIQMVGRGCRSQGQGQGILYLKGDPLIRKDAWDQVQSKSRAHKDPGGRNLLVLFRNLFELNPKDLEKIEYAYTENRWKVNPDIFECENGDTVKFLAKVDKKRQEQLKKTQAQ